MNFPSHSRREALKGSLLTFFRKYRWIALWGILFGGMLYSLMMTQQLTNTFDGLWLQNFHSAGNTELTSGRWLLVYLDRLVQGLHADPLTSMVALIFYIGGFLLILDLFAVDSKLWGCLSLSLFLSSALISSTLSYRFTSIGYGLSFLLAVLALYWAVKIRRLPLAAALSGLALGLSIACYQAYIAVFFTLGVFYIIFRCSQPEQSLPEIFLRLGCTLAAGAVIYVASLSFLLNWYGASLSGYNGIGETSPGQMLANLPRSFLNTFRFFAAYFFNDTLKTNTLQAAGIYYLALGLLGGVVIFLGIQTWRGKKRRIPILVLAAAAIPVAANAYMLVAGNKLELQMTTGLALLIPLTVILSAPYLKNSRIFRWVCCLLCLALLYGNSLQVWIDQEAMYEGRNACESIATQVISDLKEENLLSPNYEYFFVGAPSESPYFSVSELYDKANAYAQVGNFWVSESCCQVSYNGLITRHMGFNLPKSFVLYEYMPEMLNVKDMPQFPQDGYLTLLGDKIVVVKVSEYQEYTGNSKYVLD